MTTTRMEYEVQTRSRGAWLCVDSTAGSLRTARELARKFQSYRIVRYDRSEASDYSEVVEQRS